MLAASGSPKIPNTPHMGPGFSADRALDPAPMASARRGGPRGRVEGLWEPGSSGYRGAVDLHVLVAKWRSDQRASTTLLLCSALTECAEGLRERPGDFDVLVGDLARVAATQFATDANVLVAAGKMLVAAEELLEAQRVGLLAAKVAPEDPRPFRLLGEVMLRRGDADRAVRALERAHDGGASDAQTKVWLERARAYRPMQKADGAEAVARDLKWTLSSAGHQPAAVPRAATPSPPPAQVPPNGGGPRVGSAGPSRKQTVVGLGAVRPGGAPLSPAKHTLPGFPAVSHAATTPSSLPPAVELDADGKPFSNRLFGRGTSVPPSERKAGASSMPPADGPAIGSTRPPVGGAEPKAAASRVSPAEAKLAVDQRSATQPSLLFEATAAAQKKPEASSKKAMPPPPGPSGDDELDGLEAAAHDPLAQTVVARVDPAMIEALAAKAEEARASERGGSAATTSTASSADAPTAPQGVDEPRQAARARERGAAKLPADPAAQPAPLVPPTDDDGGDAWYEGLRRRPRRSMLPGVGAEGAPVEAGSSAPDAKRDEPASKASEGAPRAEDAKPSEPAKDATSSQPAKDAKPSEPAKAAEPAKAVEPAKPAAAEAGAASTPSSAAPTPVSVLPSGSPEPRLEPDEDDEPPARPSLADARAIKPLDAPLIEPSDAAGPASRRAPEPAFPPTDAPPVASFATGKPRWTRKRRMMFAALALVVLVEAAAGVLMLQRHKGAEQQAKQARELAASADEMLRGGGPRALAEAESTLARARALAPASRDVAMVELRERALAVLDGDLAALADLDAALGRAEAAKVPRADAAFARIAAALARGERAAAEAALAMGPAEPNAFFDLCAGAALEAKATAEATARYERALTREPGLFSAHVRLARALVVAGDLDAAKTRVAALAKAFPGRSEAAVLGALVRAKAGPLAPADRLVLDRAAVAELPRPLRALAWLYLIPKAVDPTADAWRLSAAVEAADVPAVAVLAGEAALEAGDGALAQKAVARALAGAPGHPAASSLAARLALFSGHLAEATKNIGALTPAMAREVRGLAAYEGGDLTALQAEIDAAPSAPRSLVQARDRLRAARPYDRAKLDLLRRSDATWSDLVAVDAALDGGELAFARDIVKVWGDVKGHPTRAVRAARLARYQGRFADARALLEGAGATHGALLEGALLAAEDKAAGAAVLAALDDRYEPEKRFLQVYLKARQGATDEARAILGKLKDPAASTPLAVRAVAALAAAEIQDGPRVDSIVTPLLKTWFNNPDVVHAGVVVGLLGRDALKKLQAQ